MPRTRAGCADTPRPCPFVSCAHHLYLDVDTRNGSLILNFPDIEPGDVPPDRSCALDVADQGGASLDEVGAVLNLTRERIRQIETLAIARAVGAHGPLLAELGDGIGLGGSRGRRRLPILEDDAA